MRNLLLAITLLISTNIYSEVIVPDLRPGSYEISEGLSSLSWTSRTAFRISSESERLKNRKDNGTLNSETYTHLLEGDIFYTKDDYNFEFAIGTYNSEYERYGSLADYDTDFIAYTIHASKKFNNFTIAAGIEKSDEELQSTHSSANEEHRELLLSLAGSYNFNENYFVGAQISKSNRKKELHSGSITTESELDFYIYTLGAGYVSNEKDLTAELFLRKETDDKTNLNSKGTVTEVGSNILYQINQFLIDTEIINSSGKSYDKKTESKFLTVSLNPEYVFKDYNFFLGAIYNFGNGSSETSSNNTNDLDIKVTEVGGAMGYRSASFESKLTITSLDTENKYANSPSSNNTDKNQITHFDVIIKF